MPAPARFYLIGGPVYRTNGSQFNEGELRKMIHQLGLGEHVGLVGFQDRAEEVYPLLDVVVHASTRPEPFGLTIVEAMACGRAVIIACEGGAAEIINHGRDALGVPSGDPAALAQALHALLRDPKWRLQLGVEARQTALKRFDQHRLGTQLQLVYRQLCPGNPQAVVQNGRAAGRKMAS